MVARGGKDWGFSGFDAARDRVCFALFDFFIVSKDFAETAFEKLP